MDKCLHALSMWEVLETAVGQKDMTPGPLGTDNVLEEIDTKFFFLIS